MKGLKALIVFGMVGLFSVQVGAQKIDKAEKRKLKKEIKAYKKDVVKYRQMKDRNRKNIMERDQTIGALTDQLDAQNLKNKALRESLAMLVGRYQNLRSMYENVGAVPTGTVYAVQIGYFTELDLHSFNEQSRLIKAETIDGAKRYVIGYFSDLNGAVQFGEDIKKIGIEDAFVSQYVDGTRNMEFDALKVK